MDYREPALIGFVQAALDYLNYSKGNGEKVDLGTLSSSDINFLRDNLGLNFESDAAAILRGHQAFRDIIYTRQNERDAFSRGDYFKGQPNDQRNNYVREAYVPKENDYYAPIKEHYAKSSNNIKAPCVSKKDSKI